MEVVERESRECLCIGRGVQKTHYNGACQRFMLRILGFSMVPTNLPVYEAGYKIPQVSLNIIAAVCILLIIACAECTSGSAYAENT